MNKFLLELFLPCSMPENITIKFLEFALAHYHDSLFEQHAITFPTRIRNSVVKRKAEYFSGRYAANSGLNELGYHDVIVGTGKQREPLWPSDVVGSISHSKNYAIAIVAKQRDVVLLGIDVEQYLTNAETQTYQKLVLLNSELELLQHAGIEYAGAIMAAFSAKEAYFKALHPLTNCYFEFLDTEIVRVELAGNMLLIWITSRFYEHALPVMCYLERHYIVSILIKKRGTDITADQPINLLTY